MRDVKSWLSASLKSFCFSNGRISNARCAEEKDFDAWNISLSGKAANLKWNISTMNVDNGAREVSGLDLQLFRVTTMAYLLIVVIWRNFKFTTIFIAILTTWNNTPNGNSKCKKPCFYCVFGEPVSSWQPDVDTIVCSYPSCCCFQNYTRLTPLTDCPIH